MIGGWLRERRRSRIRGNPFPERWLSVVRDGLPQYDLLTPAEQRVFEGDVQVFVAEKYWEGCGGLELTAEMQVTIAAHACLLTLALPQRLYPNVRSILLYPETYRAPMRQIGPGGIVTEGVIHRQGEAWKDGPVVLAWTDVVAGIRHPSDGRNVVFHEFAHKLDMLDGDADGTPRIQDTDAAYRTWYEVMSAEFQRLRHAASLGFPTLLDPYGAKDAAELFAVSTEVFFEQPRELRSLHPELYAILGDFYRQDPAARFLRPRELPREALRHASRER